MRLLLLLCLCVRLASAATPPELAAALKDFRADPPPGWSFTQTTAAQGESLVEKCDATKAEFERWSLVQKNGRAPTAGETQEYLEMRSRRSRGGTAPKITDQLDLEKTELVGTTTERLTFRCPLRPGEKGDATAPFLRATLVVHRASGTLESLELGSIGEFKPTFGVTIGELKTTLSYAPPVGDAPVLPRQVITHVRGKAFVFKSLDADMTVTFSDYAKAGRK